METAIETKLPYRPNNQIEFVKQMRKESKKKQILESREEDFRLKQKPEHQSYNARKKDEQKQNQEKEELEKIKTQFQLANGQLKMEDFQPPPIRNVAGLGNKTQSPPSNEATEN